MKKMKTKSILMLAALALLLTCVVSGTLAYLMTSTDPIENVFTPAKVTCKVDESFDGTTKNNVRIQNTGDTDAWIRATIVANWVKDDKIVAPYTLTLNPDNGWSTGTDGFYYYGVVVPAGNYTGVLLNGFTQPEGAPDGAHLELTIVCQAVQSNLGTSATAAFAAAKTIPAGN